MGGFVSSPAAHPKIVLRWYKVPNSSEKYMVVQIACTEGTGMVHVYKLPLPHMTTPNDISIPA